MAEDSLKDFSTNWIIGGFLLFCLLAFAISFMYNNDSMALDDGTNEVFTNRYNETKDRLTETTESSDALLNITANTNPEVSDLGSRDSVSTSFGAKETASSNWDDIKYLASWVFSGEAGKVLLGVVGGLIGLLSMFYIWRLIRTGL